MTQGIRTCIGCRAKKPYEDMYRIERNENEICFTQGKRHKGRGCYICSTECFERALKTNGFSRAFKTKLSKENENTLREAFL